jgi:16S rRNA processing protein RimM
LSITQTRELVAIAEVARSHGVQGELRLKVYNPETSLLAKGRRVVVRPAGAKDESRDSARKILGVREVPQALLVKIEGVTERDGADALRGATLLVPREELPALDEGEFYNVDLEGARAELVDGTLVGTVLRIASYPSCDVLVVSTPDGQTLELPLVDDVVDSVDAAARVVKLKSAEGL